MESLEDFYRRRRMADERSAANLDWEIKSTRRALDSGITPDGPVDYDDYIRHDRQWRPLESIQFYDSGHMGEIVPDAERTYFSGLFLRSAATQIGFLTDMTNPNYGIAALDLTVFGRYVHLPTGYAADLRVHTVTVPAHFERARVYSPGIGFGGGWPQGEWLVEAITGDRFYFRGRFEVI